MTHTIDEQQLAQIGNLEESSLPFVTNVRELLLNIHEEIKTRGDANLRQLVLRIESRERVSGYGYLSSSAHHDRDLEALSTALVARSFKRMNLEPLIISIDDFYSYNGTEFPSIVHKVITFSDSEIKAPNKNHYVIVLSDFTSSAIFDEKTLDSVPSQQEAGLGVRKHSKFGKKLNKFSQQLGSLFTKNRKSKHAIEEVLYEVSINAKAIQDAKLILCTSLLLQDKQKWQNLWYEGKDYGTPLYIVAPKPFHDAMNRLNQWWGHLNIDYRSRAVMGALEEPLFGEQSEPQHGLSSDEFQKRTEYLLEGLITTK